MENETEQLDMRPLLLKRFVWDIFPHDTDVVKEVQKQLGLVPDGDDGLETEHGASDTRINRAAPLSPALRILSGLAAEVIGHYMLACIMESADEDAEPPEIPEGFHESFARQNGDVIYEASYAILCHLLDTGVLAYGEKVRA